MPERILLDNDAALKIACYSLVDEMLVATTVDQVPPAILGVGRFVIGGRLARACNLTDGKRAIAAFARMLESVSLVEPTDAELEIAADFEAEANRRNLDLDGGESQLLAILTSRGCRLLITGDKRAIIALAAVAPLEAKERVACLEQLILQIVKQVGADAVRLRVCEESSVDRAITICFSCSAKDPASADVEGGLASYIRHLDGKAPGVLIRDLTRLEA